MRYHKLKIYLSIVSIWPVRWAGQGSLETVSIKDLQSEDVG